MICNYNEWGKMIMGDFDRLKECYLDIDVLINKKVDSSSEDFITWKTKIERVITNLYGSDSSEHEAFQNTTFSPLVYVGFGEHSAEDIRCCKNGLIETRARIKAYLEDYENQGLEICDQGLGISKNIAEMDFSKVFIVHGHDGELKQKIARILEKQDITPIILNEMVSRGKTIIEKIEMYSETVRTAICLFTPDDETKDGSKRARENVVFETGYFFGKIGRENTIIVAEPGVVNLSDLSGVVYINKNSWELDVLRELKDIGYAIDMNRL